MGHKECLPGSPGSLSSAGRRTEETAVPSRMLEMIDGDMREHLKTEEEYETLRRWLADGGPADAFAKPAMPADESPMEIIANRCLRCHNPEVQRTQVCRRAQRVSRRSRCRWCRSSSWGDVLSGGLPQIGISTALTALGQGRLAEWGRGERSLSMLQTFAPHCVL